jgi:hypothetical protein
MQLAAIAAITLLSADALQQLWLATVHRKAKGKLSASFVLANFIF